jgi:hypothetical protein
LRRRSIPGATVQARQKLFARTQMLPCLFANLEKKDDSLEQEQSDARGKPVSGLIPVEEEGN